jgi:hypothetical protein
MENYIYHIYDKIFKKILTLSSTAVTNMINGLFGTEYPADSTITYNWTKFEDKELKRILADTIVTVNGSNSYHMEAQMTNDEDIIFRVFEYGYSHANRNSSSDNGRYILPFPEPKIIYFCTSGNVPDEYILELDFGSQGVFNYKVSTFNYLKNTPEELTEKRLIILIPFELLKLRDIMKKERTPELLSELKYLIMHDIIGSIDINLKAGNITQDDARKLKRLTHKLYEHIYAHYKELEEVTDMTDESLMLDIDIIEKEHEKELAKVIAEKDTAISEKDNALAQITEKNKVITEKDKEITLLKKQLAELSAK